MTVQLGREIPPGSPEYIWVSNVIASVEKRSGLNSSWNGKLYEESENYQGTSNPDGSLALSRSMVLDRVRDAMQGKKLSQRELNDLRDAVLTTVHEALHLSSRDGDPRAPGATPLADAAETALDEGLTESWSHANVDAVIYDLGMDLVQPELVARPGLDPYQAYTAATGALAHGLGTVAQVDAEDIRRTLLTAERTQRWNAVADLIIDKRLAGLMPPEDRETVRRELTDRMRTEFAKLPAIQSERTRAAAKGEAGHRVGVAAVIAVQQYVNQTETDYRRQAAVQAQTPKLAPWQLPGQAPGRPARQIQFPTAARRRNPGRGQGD